MPLWDTINIATLGTLLGIIIAVPVAFLAARNTTPSATLVRPLALLIIVASRSINSLIWALLLSDLSAPGYLRFHLVTTTIDAREFIESAIDSGQTATDSLGDVRVTKTGELDP